MYRVSACGKRVKGVISFNLNMYFCTTILGTPVLSLKFKSLETYYMSPAFWAVHYNSFFMIMVNFPKGV